MSRTQQVIFTSLHLSKLKFWVYREKKDTSEQINESVVQSVISLKTNDNHREQQWHKDNHVFS